MAPLTVDWDLTGETGQRVAPGMYFVRFTVGDHRQNKSVLVRR